MRAVQIEEFGGPEVLQVVDLPKPEPGDGQVLIEVSRAGMNFADTHQRENSYLARYEMPLVLGRRGGGQDRGRPARGRAGGERRLRRVRAWRHEATVFDDPRRARRRRGAGAADPGPDRLAPVPDLGQARQGESAVVISGAGGVGSLAVQLAKPFGAGRVIATASTEEKRELALELGADAAVDPAAEDLKARSDRGQRGQPGGRGAGDVGRPRVRRLRRGARAVRADRGLRDRRARAEHGRDRPADAQEPQRWSASG